MRLAAATSCAGLAFAVLDLSAGLRRPQSFLRAALRTLCGLGFLWLALRLVASLPLDNQRTFGILATAVVFAGLAVDAVAGETIRAGMGLRR